MGWDYHHAEHYTKNGSVDRKKELDQDFTWNSETRSYEVLKSKMVGTTYYAAVKNHVFETGDEYVWGLVCLTRTDMKDYFNFGKKAMDETMGPCAYDCPKNILELLTPTDNEFANAWRQACWNKINNPKPPLGKLPIGTKIKISLGDEEKILIKEAPAYQFRKPWWRVDGKTSYWGKKYIPDNYVVID